MDPCSTNVQPHSIIIPGIEQPVSLESHFAESLPGLLNNLSVPHDNGVLNYTERHLGELLGETGPIVHPNLKKDEYISSMKAIFDERNKGPSPAWSSVESVSAVASVGAAAIYNKCGADLSSTAREITATAVILFAIVAFVSLVIAMEPRRDEDKHDSYPYLDVFSGGKPHIKWKEYWRIVMTGGYDSAKLKGVADLANEFGFRIEHLRKPSLVNKGDDTPLSGIDIRESMEHYAGRNFAEITSLLWAAEVARRSVGKPLREEINSLPANAEYFLKFAQALTGQTPTELSLSEPYSQAVADLIDSAAYYAALANKVPMHAAALSAFLARYYFKIGNRSDASSMMYAMYDILQGQWRSAFTVHMSAVRKNLVAGVQLDGNTQPDENVQPEKRAVNAIHHLAIARLMHERMIDANSREIGLGAYSYASSAASIFDEFARARDMREAAEQWNTLKTRAADIMQVMVNNGPFVEFT